MALREVLQFPDPRLRRLSKPIASVTDEIRQLASDMLEVMYDEPGIGLAAPQVGEPIRLVVMDTEWTAEDGERCPRVLLNPEILEREGKLIWNEGCLSVPDFQADVERSAWVRVRALDLDGEEILTEAEELEAVCFQHEIDHLDGKLFIDRISRLKRELYVGRRKKALRRGAEEGRDGASSAGDARL
ncbi:MAG: peptide deformylase [Myxococcota bacterium]